MREIVNQKFDEERALYGSKDIILVKCSFDGPEDGESALKESTNVKVENCFCNLRYPFWHVHGLKISDTEMTELCRAALWYSDNINIKSTKMHGIKALRECENITISNCDIISPEFGWSVKNIIINDSIAQSEYFMMRSENIRFKNVEFKGKYSFQYIKDAYFENCIFDTKDAFWHGENITVKNSVIKGEYLAWYSDGLTLENCEIIGTQPFCYCKNLKLVNCRMIDTDLCFEKSDVEADITTSLISIKNPSSGRISALSVNEIIMDNKNPKVQIVLSK